MQLCPSSIRHSGLQAFLYYFGCSMNDQPIIIEEPLAGNPQKKSRDLQKQQTFFELLDEVEEYDAIATTIRQKYRQAMLGVASIKFNQPHAINIAAHKCLPAFLRISPEGSLVYQYSSFTNPAPEEDVYPDEFQQQEQNEQVCLQRQEELSSCSEQEKRRQICENELLGRFDVISQQSKVLQIANQFKGVIELLLQLSHRRSAFESTVNKLSRQSE